MQELQSGMQEAWGDAQELHNGKQEPWSNT
jgi:hypothetical protein